MNYWCITAIALRISNAAMPVTGRQRRPPRTPIPRSNSRFNKCAFAMPSPHRDPLFPGAVPVSPSEDAAVFFRQTGQSAPLSALIGKPAGCACRHGVAQAYSLDPMPPPPPPSPSSGGARAGRRRRGATARINSGLLKLTCPALVRAVDELEDSGAMGGLNARLARDGAWREFVEEAHGVHAAARRRFVFGDDENDDAPSPPRPLRFRKNTKYCGPDSATREHGPFSRRGWRGPLPDWRCRTSSVCTRGWRTTCFVRKITAAATTKSAAGIR